MRELLFIDLFSGAGGATSGIEAAMVNGNKCARVLAAVNHDDLAIQSHAANHPGTIHFVEDIRTLDVSKLLSIVIKERTKNPDALVCIWASLECTNFSKAKGGLPRDADSRTLAEHLYKYVEVLHPEMIFIENVEEFMSWGPLDEFGKPISRTQGRDYIKWLNTIKAFGYNFDYKILNAADYGAFTSRKRYFAQFAQYGLPMHWPEPTHSKNPQKGMFGSLKKWNAVKHVLDLNDVGTSIFERKKPLVDKTLERIYAGLVKYVAKGDGLFIAKYNSAASNGDMKHTAADISSPAPVIATQGRLALVSTFIVKNYSGDPTNKVISVNGPSGAITTIDHHSIISSCFLTSYYGNSKAAQSIDNSAPTLTTKDRLAMVSAEQFITRDFKTGRNSSLESPCGSLLTVPKVNLVSVSPFLMNTSYNNKGADINNPAPTLLACRKAHYLVNPQYQSKGASIHQPCFTLIARMDKMPPSIVSVEHGQVFVHILPDDSLVMQKIKQFMVDYQILDIKMRMLKISELKKITGFPESYILHGSQADQKKFIGNAVVVQMARKIIESTASALAEQKTKTA